MDYVLQMLTTNFGMVVGGISTIILILIYLVTKKAPDAKTSTMITGVTDNVIKLIITILEGVKADHVGLNKSLKFPIELPIGKDKDSVNLAKHLVAEQAIKENIPNKTLIKIIKVTDNVSSVYELVKKFYPLLRAKLK